MKRYAVLMALVLLTWASADALAGTCTIQVSAWIDGRSHLILRGNTAQWHHYDYTAPGREDMLTEPTIINGSNWYPVWPDVPNAANHDCDCDSDVFNGVFPPLPSTDMTLSLKEIQVRDQVSIVEQPSAGNNYTLIIEFNDNSSGGADWYTIEFDFECQDSPVPTLNQWGMIILGLLVAGSAVLVLRRRKRES